MRWIVVLACLFAARAAAAQPVSYQLKGDVPQGQKPQIRVTAVIKVADVRIELFGWPTSEQRQALLEGRIDIAFMLGPFAAPGIATRLLREEEIVVVMPKGHPLARHKLIEPQQLHNERLIMGSPASWSIYRRTIFNEFDRAGVPPLVAQEAPTSSAIFSLVSAGMGITIFPEEASRSYRGQLIVRPLRMQHGNVTTICAWTKGSDNAEIAPFLECVPDRP